ncbi:MAG: 4-hydroxy-3-methylbut-2-enyl diphosphate reductase [Muribaculaceae bacterium]|nr:4-hydroxy-3-methylbut-2-enyl diphosphate reductase [Muribaculaceae bacterium]
MRRVEIDPGSGFCFGVVTAIEKAEAQLSEHGSLYCLGDIVHNNDEVERLRKRGLTTISHHQMAQLHDTSVLLRAHGEPPETYKLAKENNIRIIDATCPVVLKLQQRIKVSCADSRKPQIVIYGQNGHAEVNGLVGQTAGQAIVVEGPADLDKIDYGRDVTLYSQTTKSLEGFQAIAGLIKERMKEGAHFEYFDTICRRVSNRVEHLRRFAQEHDVVLFVAGTKSSNGKILFNHCHSANPNTYLIPNATHLNPEWLTGAETIGICGATSTPRWLMEQVRDAVLKVEES